MTLRLTSPAFESGQQIPEQYTCDGAGGSPPLRWTDAPRETQSFALIVEDPDAPSGSFVHWLAFNIPADRRELPAGMNSHGKRADGIREGRNSARAMGYGPPCPPHGPAHRYLFKLYALRSRLELSEGASRQDLERAMQGQVVGSAELMGLYAR